MKILTVVSKLSQGGAHRAAINFANAYSALGHDSRLLVIDHTGSRQQEIQKLLKVHKYSKKDLYEIKNFNSDFVHLHSHGLTLEQVNCIIGYLAESTKLFETNVFSFPQPWEKQLSGSFQLSQWAMKLYRIRGGDPQKIYFCPNPVDTSFFNHNIEKVVAKKYLNIRNEHVVIGRVGQSFEGKWSLQTIKIFEKLRERHKNLRLLLVGASPSVIQRAKISKFAQDVIILEQVLNDNEIKIVYSAIDIFLHIARQGESFGMVLAEAMLERVPVITMRTPWGDNSQGEVVGENTIKGGVVVKNKISAIKEAEKLINSSIQLSSIGMSGKKHIEEKYDYIKVAKLALKYMKNTQTNNQSAIKESKHLNLKNTIVKKFLIKLNFLLYKKFMIIYTGFFLFELREILRIKLSFKK